MPATAATLTCLLLGLDGFVNPLVNSVAPPWTHRWPTFHLPTRTRLHLDPCPRALQEEVEQQQVEEEEEGGLNPG